MSKTTDGGGCLVLIFIISLCISTCSVATKVDSVSSDTKIIINQNKILEKQLVDLDNDFKKLDSAFTEYKKTH